jgi:hypothetical protein
VGGAGAQIAARPGPGAALAGGPLDPGLFSVTVTDAASSLPDRRRPREIELARVGGRPYFVFYEHWDRSWIVPASGSPASGVRTRFGVDELTTLVTDMVAGARLVEARLIESYDAYYYSVGAVAPKRLPIFRVAFNDPDGTWYYIDPHTGSIFRRYDRHGRLMRWLVNGLHTFDLPLLFAHRPAWDLAIIAFSAGGLFLSVTGMIIGWRRVAVASKAAARHG